MRLLGVLAMALAAGACASNPARTVVVAPAISPAEVEARLGEADALAARGCYVCLREASGAYFNLLAISDSPIIARHALENELMMAMREGELRLPDSGAKERAVRLKADTTYDYEIYFSLIDKPADVLMTPALMRQRDDERKALADTLAAAWPTSALAANSYN